jgi:hemerythrin-like domain-containing protein
MNPVKILRDEHEKVFIELDELDFIITEPRLNYSNLVHTFWKVCELWNPHEKMEEKIFKVMEREGFVIPIETILLTHEDLRGKLEKINGAINSGSDFEVKSVLVKEMKEFVDVLRKNMEDEDEILFGVIVSNLSDEGMEEIRNIVLRAVK